MKKKVLYIDPWGIKNTADYAKGIIQELKKYVDLTVIENFRCSFPRDETYKIHKWFFPISQIITLKHLRRLVRGIEYVLCWCWIYLLIKRNSFDVVHINWLLSYKIDIFFLKLIRPYCDRLVYTAHNVLPHINGERYLGDLEKIYNLVDNVILHGNSIKGDFAQIFPDYVDKVYIQYHGCNICDQSLKTCMSKISLSRFNIQLDPSEFDKILIFFGQLYWDKGIDRVINYWKGLTKLPEGNKNLLIVAGPKLDSNYLKTLDVGLLLEERLLYLPFYLKDEELSSLINISDCVLLPYRHASMSGVVFTAAYHKKTILSTDVGAIPEYLEQDRDSFICSNNDRSLQQTIEKVLETPKEVLRIKGDSLHDNFMRKYVWGNIVKKLVRDIYNQ